MKYKSIWIDFMMCFFIVTACVTILEGIMGMIFLPDMRFGYDAFFSPPLFGILSAVSSLITYSSKEMTVRQATVRKIIHLCLIEAMVFGLNAASGNFYEAKLCVAMILSIAVIYVTVNFVMWVNDQRSAQQFNQRLKVFQERNKNCTEYK